MKKFINDLYEVGKDIISGLYSITIKGPVLFMWWIGQVYNDNFAKENKEDGIIKFEAMASDICKVVGG